MNRAEKVGKHFGKGRSSAPAILLVDDDCDQLFIYQSLLESRGYQVIPAGSANEALEILKTIYVDLVICDVLMPNISGEEFIHRARQARGLAHLPIITFTAASPDLRSKLIKAGASSFVEKANATQELLGQVTSLLDSSKQNKTLLEQIRERFD